MIIPAQVYKILDSSELSSENILAAINKLKAGEFVPPTPTKPEIKLEPEIEQIVVVPQKKEELKIMTSGTQNRQNSIFSLKNKLSEKSVVKEDPEQERLSALEEAFSLEEAQWAWNDICERYNKQKEVLSKSMFSAELEVPCDNEIRAKVATGVLAKDIESNCDVLQLELRRKLKNGKIKLLVQVSDDVKREQLPYTPQEKYDYMAKKNYLLAELRKKLNLDITY